MARKNKQKRFSVAEEMQKRLNDPEFMIKIMKKSEKKEGYYIDDICETLGTYLGHFIAVRDGSDPLNETFETIEERNDYYDKYGYNRQYYRKKGLFRSGKKAEIKEKIFENILQKGYITHAFNGYNLEAVKKYGLGDPRVFDEKLEEDLTFFCEKLGESRFYDYQGNKRDEFYYSSPGKMSFHYACKYSPERLWEGPLGQPYDDTLPIIVGESRADYAIRVMNHKLEKLDVSEEEKKHIAEVGMRVIDALCTKKPVIALIPLKSDNYQLTAYLSSTTYEYNDENPKIEDRMAWDGEGMLSRDPFYFFRSRNFADLVHVGRIPPEELEFIEVEDAFVLKQMWTVVNYGLQVGDEIEPYSGMPYRKDRAYRIRKYNSETKRNVSSTKSQDSVIEGAQYEKQEHKYKDNLIMVPSEEGSVLEQILKEMQHTVEHNDGNEDGDDSKM